MRQEHDPQRHGGDPGAASRKYQERIGRKAGPVRIRSAGRDHRDGISADGLSSRIDGDLRAHRARLARHPCGPRTGPGLSRRCGHGRSPTQAVSSLSGGQRQRVLIARALATEPDILLLDEPLSGIDVQAAQVIMGLIERLHRERRLTMVMVSHHLKALREHEAVREVIWVYEGKLQRGSVETMLSPEMVYRMMDAEIG